MTKRSPIAVLLLPIITLGIYGIVWYVKTKGEMVSKGAEIPTAWLLIVPIVNWWWAWKYSQGVEKVTKGGSSAGVTFALLFFLGCIGMAITQNAFNNISDGGGAPKAEEKPAPSE
jgi:hypothetical protein